MKLEKLKNTLKDLTEISIMQTNGVLVPPHFHLTEIGKVTKEFIDCGATRRKDEVISLQLWTANDFDHRLEPSKMLGIIEQFQKTFKVDDLEIEVEYQADTIGKFGLDFKNNRFVLTSKQTDCLAKDNCGIPEYLIDAKEAVASCCTPGSGCC